MYRCRAIDGGERRPLVAWLLLAGELIADRPAALVEDHPRNPIEERRAFAIAGPDTDHVAATVRPEAILGVLVPDPLKKLLAHRLDIACSSFVRAPTAPPLPRCRQPARPGTPQPHRQV